MTVADNTSRNQYTATSGQTVFAYTFEIVDKDHVVVLKNGVALSEGTNYTVSNVGNDNGGNITLASGATAGDIITLYRDMPYSRTQNYTNSGDFLASEVNSDFDELWLAGEQTDRSFEQSIRKPITDSDSISMELPEAANRANKFIKFDATGAVDVASSTPTVTADAVTITDTGNYYTSNDVEGALQEVGADLTANTAKLSGIEAGADVTDTANVTAAGALMDSEVTNLDQVKAFDQTDYATSAQGTTADAALPRSGGAMTGPITTNSTFDGRDVAIDGTKLDGIEAGATTDQTAAEIKTAYESNLNTNAFTDADESKLDGIENSADVTDTANVTAAGALMDSELTNESAVKALNQGVATTDSPSFAGATISSISYPATDGSNGQVITTDGSGTLTFSTVGASLTDVSVDSFTGTGSQTGFTLSGDPGSENNLQVYIDGVYQNKDTFTVVSTTLTFSEAPPSNALIEACTFNEVGSITVPADGSVNSAKIASGSVTEAKIASGAVTSSKLGGNLVTPGNLNVTGDVTASGATISSLSYPTSDGSNGQVLTTDGSGNLTFTTAGASLTDVSVDSFTGTGTQTAFTLSVDPGSENNLQVYIQGVYQNKDTFSISGTTLTFSEAPPLNSEIEACTINETGTINVPADASVTSAKLSGNLTTPGNLDVTGDISVFDATPSLNLYDSDNSTRTTLTNNNGISYLRAYGITSGTYGSFILASNNDTTSKEILRADNSNIQFKTDGTLRGRFLSNGDYVLYNDAATSTDFYWDASSSRLGLGTTNPITDLELEGVDRTLRLTDTGSNSSFIKLETDNFNPEIIVSRQGANPSYARLVAFGNEARLEMNNLSGKISKIISDGGGRMEFETDSVRRMNILSTGDILSYADDGTTEGMRWDASSSRLGLGTPLPSTTLEIEDNANGQAAGDIPTVRLTNSDTTTIATDITGSFEFYSKDASSPNYVSGFVRNVAEDAGVNYALTFGSKSGNSNATEHMRLKSDGNIQIGTAAVTGGRYFDIYNTGSTATDFAITRFITQQVGSSSTTSADIVKRKNGEFSFVNNDTNSAAYINFKIGASNVMRLKSNGRVGIGTDSPANKLTVSESSADFAALIQNSLTSGNGLKIQAGDNSGDRILQLDDKDGNEKFRVTALGNVLFGTVGTIGAFASDLTIGKAGAGLRFEDGTVSIRPHNMTTNAGSDDAVNLGWSDTRFDNIYATNGTIQTSDRNEKQDIEELSDAEQRVAVAAKGLLRKYRWVSRVETKGDDARIHFGIIAQDLQDAFTAEGLDAGRYGMFINSTWTDEETGEERSRMGVRYSELLAFIISAI